MLDQAGPIAARPIANPAQKNIFHQTALFSTTLDKTIQQAPVRNNGQPTRQDLEKDADGQIEYTVQPDDSLTEVGRRFGRGEDEIKASNPRMFTPYANQNVIHPGQKLVILNDDRAKVALEMVKTTDPAQLKELVTLDLTYATRGLATPGDQLAATQQALIDRRPGDAAFAALVKEQGAKLTQAWQSQGRTHEVWDGLNALAAKGDWEGVKALISDQIATLAATTPTIDAVNDYKTMLLTYGPDNPAFDTAVNQAVDKFLVGDPAAAAAEAAQVYERDGALAASQKLKDLTDPEKTNPLTAALIADKAQATLIDIASDFVDPTQSLWHDEQGKGVTGDYGAIYHNLSAVADSIHRSPEGAKSIDLMASILQAHGAGMVDAKGAAADGSGVVLSLAIAEKLLEYRDSEGVKAANRITRDVQSGVEELKTHVRDSVTKLGQAAAPLLGPGMNWNVFLGDPNGPAGQPFKAPDTFSRQWLDQHPDEMRDIDAAMTRLNVEGYHLERAMAGLEDYAPRLDGAANKQDLLAQAAVPDPQQDPGLSMALAVSSGALQDGLRRLNLEGGNSGQLAELSKIVPDASWPTRMTRNQIQADVKALTGTKPFGVGLSLFGTGTYIWGVRDHGKELGAKVTQDGWKAGLFEDNGWRNLGFLGMYAGGIAIESGQVFAQLASDRLGLTPTDAGWKGAVGRAAISPEPKTATGWGKLFLNHLKWFGWYNAIGTANYAAQGNWPKTAALGIATAGTLLNAYPAVGAALHLGRFAGPVGTALTLIGSAGIYALNERDQAKIAAETEPFNKDYLIAAGVKPEIANALADNDADGLSPAPRLLALAKDLDIEPAKLLEWLNNQDAKFVGEFVRHALNPLKPDGDGNFVQRVGKEEWDPNSATYKGEVRVYPAPYPGAVPPTDPDVWNRASIAEAQSLEGIRIWAQASGHPLPTA